MPSVTRRSRGHRERREEIDERVLDTTADLLSDGEGFTQLSVERIAAAADVSRSTFYVHFSDKTDLLIRLAERAMGDSRAARTRCARSSSSWCGSGGGTVPCSGR